MAKLKRYKKQKIDDYLSIYGTDKQLSYEEKFGNWEKFEKFVENLVSGKIKMQEMAMFPSLEIFLSKTKKVYDINSKDYKEQKGWKNLQSFLGECLKSYINEGLKKDITFSEILEREKLFYKEKWTKIPNDLKITIEKFVKSLDKEERKKFKTG